MPRSIFQTQTAIVSYAGTVVYGFILWCDLYYPPRFFQAVKGYNPILSGIALFPVPLTVAPGAITTGILVTKTGRYRWAVWCGWDITISGLGLIIIIDVESSTVAWIFILIVAGVGLGMAFTALSCAVQASVKVEDLAIAVAMFSFFRALGQTLGVASGGMISQNRRRTDLLTYPQLRSHATQYSKYATKLVDIINTIPDGADKQDLRQAYSDSLRNIWAVSCGLAGLAGVLKYLDEEVQPRPGTRIGTIS
jgi:hypothetical protein